VAKSVELHWWRSNSGC